MLTSLFKRDEKDQDTADHIANGRRRAANAIAQSEVNANAARQGSDMALAAGAIAIGIKKRNEALQGLRRELDEMTEQQANLTNQKADVEGRLAYVNMQRIDNAAMNQANKTVIAKLISELAAATGESEAALVQRMNVVKSAEYDHVLDEWNVGGWVPQDPRKDSGLVARKEDWYSSPGP